jgi:hypothetical protein
MMIRCSSYGRFIGSHYYTIRLLTEEGASEGSNPEPDVAVHQFAIATKTIGWF